MGGCGSGGAIDILRTRLRPLILYCGINSTRVIINRFWGHILSIVLRRPHDQPIDPEIGAGIGKRWGKTNEIRKHRLYRIPKNINNIQ